MNMQSDELVEHFFRHESARLVAVLARGFGFALIDVIEDMVQEAVMEALSNWRINGVPENPSGWLHRVARNRIIDSLRRNQKRVEQPESEIELPGNRKVTFELDEIQDSVLRMIFACCHPALDRPSQLALTLKLVCGFSTDEVASGLLASKEATKKRITRAKRTLQLNQIDLDLPARAALSERLDAVHDVLYLMFNEGYASSGGDSPVRIDLCEEAARLCHDLCSQPEEHVYSTPTTRALLSLMLFHAARLESRLSDEGEIILLSDQDRSKWDRDMIKVAEYWLMRSAERQEISHFHLEAGIARVHCRAESIDQTDWREIIGLYGLLIEMKPSPVYRLNRASAFIAAGRLSEAEDEIQVIETSQLLKNYALLHCVAADLYLKQGNADAAVKRLRQAIDCVTTKHQRELIESRIREIER